MYAFTGQRRWCRRLAGWGGGVAAFAFMWAFQAQGVTTLADWSAFDDHVAEVYEGFAHDVPCFPPAPCVFRLTQTPLAFDPDGFTDLTNAIPPDTLLGVPVWHLSVVETQATERVWITMSGGQPVWTNAVPTSFDGDQWVRDAYGDPPDWLSGSALELWYRCRERKRIAVHVTLIPADRFDDYESALLAARANALPPSDAGPVMPADPESLAFAGVAPEPGGLKLWLYAPAESVPVDLFATPGLTPAPVWELAGTLLAHAPFTPWTTATAQPTRFFTGGRLDVDSDGDGISDSRERLLFGSDPERLGQRRRRRQRLHRAVPLRHGRLAARHGRRRHG